MKVDSHHHLWTLARGDYGWMTPDLGPIYQDFAPLDLAPHLSAAGIEKTVVVQAADTLAETEFLLSLAADTPWIAGVVGWIDMEADSALADLARLAQNPLFKGIRPMIQSLADDDWILRPGLNRVFDALVEADLAFDALVLPRHLPQLLQRLTQHPDLRCVIDHCAKPELATGQIDPWRDDMARLARDSGAFCKFSGLVTEAGPGYTLDTLRPVAEHVIAEFGPARLMFGSDWPVLDLAGDYAGWLVMVEALIEGFGAEDLSGFWGGNAIGFYQL